MTREEASIVLAEIPTHRILRRQRRSRWSFPRWIYGEESRVALHTPATGRYNGNGVSYRGALHGRNWAFNVYRGEDVSDGSMCTYSVAPCHLAALLRG